MKKLGLLGLTAMMALPVFVATPSEAEAQTPQCNALARRVHRYRQIRTDYQQRWRACNWQSGTYSPRCQHLRNTVLRWNGHVARARADYRSWGCTFRWGVWNDPWAPAPAPVVVHGARCNNLAVTVNNYRRIRANYLQQWNQCRWDSGAYSPQCQNLRAAVLRWNGHVNAARANYNAWGCTFRWGVWNDPWAPAPTAPVVVHGARCNNLAVRVARYRQIRADYLQRWRNCNWESGSYSNRCQRLRNRVLRWNGHVNTARANYRAWGCTFRWGVWNDPWR